LNVRQIREDENQDIGEKSKTIKKKEAPFEKNEDFFFFNSFDSRLEELIEVISLVGDQEHHDIVACIGNLEDVLVENSLKDSRNEDVIVNNIIGVHYFKEDD